MNYFAGPNDGMRERSNDPLIMQAVRFGLGVASDLLTGRT